MMMIASFFCFFFDTLSSLLRRIYYQRMLSFQASVRHIPCTIWSSSQLSTYEFSFFCGITSHIMLLSWGPRCLGSASSAPWRLRLLRHLRGLRPLQVKTMSWGRIYNIYSSPGVDKNGIYGWPVISQTRSCVGGSPCSRSVEPGSFCVASHLRNKQAQNG